MPCVVNSGFCNPRTTQKRGESFGISKIGNKIKGVFKSSAMEGAILPNYNFNEGEDDFVSKSSSLYLTLSWCFYVCCVVVDFFFFSLFGNVKLLLFLLFYFTAGVSTCWLLIKLPCFPCTD